MVAVLSALAFPGSDVSGGDKPAKTAKELFEERCSICHGLDRAKDHRRAADEWARTVRRMREVFGAKLTDEEAKTIIDYLSKHFRK
jgi:mono/diheme cytochrome c family protein